MLSTDADVEVAEMLLADAAELQVVDMHGNTALHQVGWVKDDLGNLGAYLS